MKFTNEPNTCFPKVILELYKKLKENNGNLKIKNVDEEIRKSFNLVGFNKFLSLD